jgi:hypothetical protein
MNRPSGVSRKKVLSLIQLSDWHLDTGMTARASSTVEGTAIYRCLDGKVLKVLSDGIGHLYNSEEAWLTDWLWVESIAAGPSMSHVLDGKLPHKGDFGIVSHELAQQLPLLLKIDSAQLDNSIDSLKAIDSVIKKVGLSESFSAQLFEPLLAYIGEVAKSAAPDTHWEMRKLENAPNEETWEPWLVVSQEAFPVFIWLYDELYEARRPSIEGLVTKLLAF